MRESSVTLPSSSGTLKSTRVKTRFPVTSASRTVSLSMGGSGRCAGRALARGELRRDEAEQVRATAAVAPLVVVPGDDLDHRPAQHHRARRVDDRGPGVTAEVRRHQLLVGDAEDALHRSRRGRPERLVDLLWGRRPSDVRGEVDDPDRGGRYAQAEAV